MSFSVDVSHTPANTNLPLISEDPLVNLSAVQSRMDSLHKFLSDSVNSNTLLGQHQINMVSDEITSAIHQIIVNGAAILSSTQSPNPISNHKRTFSEFDDRGDSSEDKVSELKVEDVTRQQYMKAITAAEENNTQFYVKNPQTEENPRPDTNSVRSTNDKRQQYMKPTTTERNNTQFYVENPQEKENPRPVSNSTNLTEVLDDDEEGEIIELDAVELLAEHIHFCDYCGKGFKRDANLRMHMRAHGNQYKTPEALAKPEKKHIESSSGNKTKRFSCPFVGCCRNKMHKKFRPLKSAICVKNHFKRSHCPRMYSCTRCNKKSFSVLADLKSHLKHCGETKWKCSCGTSFSRKDKLFGHMALFEGHMPAVEGEEENVVMDIKTGLDNGLLDIRTGSDDGFLDRLMLDDGFESIDSYCFQDLLGSSSPNGLNTVNQDTTGWFDS
ncbi:protein SENSITIVE TO PROTON RHIZOTOXICITY 2-like [Lycium barbarum]|uniref:protein SENSITIVE TO PROTON RHIZOTOXICITY 2-like n=1 Tax=Lycium barbarum TaxID=112863 RepID=UPI00293EF643|nr:protein SENSITIVE TO PROTON RHIZOTOXICITY 2-like [Lycium barbarum]